MKMSFFPPIGDIIEVDLPCRLNKGDRIYPFAFVTKEDAGVSEEAYDEYEHQFCYVQFMSFRTTEKGELTMDIILGDFESKYSEFG